MLGSSLGIPVEAGNLLVWVWLEVSVLAAVMQWTSILSRLIVRCQLRAGKSVRLRRKKTLIDKLPCNADLRPLPMGPKLLLTLIRILFLVLAAASGIGIDAGHVYSQGRPTTHVLQMNDASFKGRAFNESAADSVQDISVVGCEDINSVSLEKNQAFIGPTYFSCNSGRTVGARSKLVEVIWNKEQVRRVLSGKSKPPKVVRGEKSCISAKESRANLLFLTACNGAPDVMFVGRREAGDFSPGSCENGSPKEYLVVSNNRNFIIALNNVAVAYVLCEKEKPVFMRSTDQVLNLPTLGAGQQIRLARKVANSLVSIVPDKRRMSYSGKTRRVTSIAKRYGYLILALSLLNPLLLATIWIYYRATTGDSEIDGFCPHFMFMLGYSQNSDFQGSDERNVKDVLVKKIGSRDKWNIVATID